jgi:predicted metalloendopeptidase
MLADAAWWAGDELTAIAGPPSRHGVMEDSSAVDNRRIQLTATLLTGPSSRLLRRAKDRPARLALARRVAGSVQRVFRDVAGQTAWLHPTDRAAAKRKAQEVVIAFAGDTEASIPIAEMPTTVYSMICRIRSIELASAVTTSRHIPKSSPLAVSATYYPIGNVITLPIALLDSPWLELRDGIPETFGSFGACIGHELGHAIDPAGAQTNPQGRPYAWWSAATSDLYKSLQQRCLSQLEEFGTGQPSEPSTVNEAIADLFGLQMAAEALRRWRDVAELTADDARRFFEAWAKTWRTNGGSSSPATPNGHLDPAIRANWVLRNFDEFIDGYHIREGHRMWLPTEQRLSLIGRSR